MEAILQIEDLETRIASVEIIETCAWCKRVKIPGSIFHKAHWVSREAVELSAENALFSHGICPQCKQRLADEN